LQGPVGCKVSGKQCTDKRRANETKQETVECRASDRQCMAKKKANETEQETVELVPLKLKRKLLYKRYNLCDYVSPQS